MWLSDVYYSGIIGLLYGQLTLNQALITINLLVLVFNVPFVAVYVLVSHNKVLLH